MATILDIGFLQQFDNLFIVLFVFVVVYAILSSSKNPLGNNKPINAFAAFIFSIIFLFSPDAVAVVKWTVPWMMIITFFVIFIIIAWAVMAGEAGWTTLISESARRPLANILLIIFIILILLGVSNVIGQKALRFTGNGNEVLVTSEGERIPINGVVLDQNGNRVLVDEKGTIIVDSRGDPILLDDALRQGSVASDSFEENLGATLFHPKIVGVIVVMLTMSMAVWLLSYRTVG